jgi:hypothetical protein
METKTICSKQLLRGIFVMFMFSLFSIGAFAQNGPNSITRADYLNYSPIQQKDVWLNYVDYTIVDLVNWTPAVAQSRNALIWLTDSQFHTAPYQKKHSAMLNPNIYIIVDDPNLIPLITITQAQFDALPKEKQIDIKNSGQYVIVP